MAASKAAALPLGDAPTKSKKQATSPERDGGNIEISLRTCNDGYCAFLSWLEVGIIRDYNGCHSSSGGVWRSLVAHLLREQGVVSSNLATPTNKTKVHSGHMVYSFSGNSDLTPLPTGVLHPIHNVPHSCLCSSHQLCSNQHNLPNRPIRHDNAGCGLVSSLADGAFSYGRR